MTSLQQKKVLYQMCLLSNEENILISQPERSAEGFAVSYRLLHTPSCVDSLETLYALTVF